MVIGRTARREERRARVATSFPADHVDAALDLLELMELAWHDCYGESTPPEARVDDVLLIADGSLSKLVRASRLLVMDSRDVIVSARRIRGEDR